MDQLVACYPRICLMRYDGSYQGDQRKRHTQAAV
jgi:hypothetical protein